MKQENEFIRVAGQTLQSLREAQFYSIEEISSFCRIDSSSYEQYEKGEAEISLRQFYQIALFLAIKPSDLLSLIMKRCQSASFTQIPDETIQQYGSDENITEEFIGNFLKVNGSSRGTRFQEFVSQLRNETDN